LHKGITSDTAEEFPDTVDDWEGSVIQPFTDFINIGYSVGLAHLSGCVYALYHDSQPLKSVHGSPYARQQKTAPIVLNLLLALALAHHPLPVPNLLLALALARHPLPVLMRNLLLALALARHPRLVLNLLLALALALPVLVLNLLQALTLVSHPLPALPHQNLPDLPPMGNPHQIRLSPTQKKSANMR
jgi:hypothetical protein